MHSTLSGLSQQGLSSGPVISNHSYDKFAGNTGQMFGVQDAATQMQQTRALGSIHMSAELPASITREQIPSACLPYYFLQARNMTKTAYIYIINNKTMAFIPTQNGITVIDSHYHETSGAFLAIAPADAARELLSWFNAVNNIPHSLGQQQQLYYSYFPKEQITIKEMKF